MTWVVAATAVAGPVLLMAGAGLAPGQLQQLPIDHPFGLEGAAGPVAWTLRAAPAIDGAAARRTATATAKNPSASRITAVICRRCGSRQSRSHRDQTTKAMRIADPAASGMSPARMPCAAVSVHWS